MIVIGTRNCVTRLDVMLLAKLGDMRCTCWKIMHARRIDILLVIAQLRVARFTRSWWAKACEALPFRSAPESLKAKLPELSCRKTLNDRHRKHEHCRSSPYLLYSSGAQKWHSVILHGGTILTLNLDDGGRDARQLDARHLEVINYVAVHMWCEGFPRQELACPCSRIDQSRCRRLRPTLLVLERMTT